MRVTVLVALALGLAACGGSATPRATTIQFGIAGGNIAPYTITISPSGAVRAGGHQISHSHLSASTVASFSQFPSGVESRRCAGTLPDIASQFVRVGGRTVLVHGNCEPSFSRLFSRLTQAVGLKTG